ncbi:hypothetical protein LJC17_01755 [Acholeplasma sp. OttesenSCG-928-E16]|nr:hypothetical protein [Acholeplasma sp. OttesenSCG-928-E16]
MSKKKYYYDLHIHTCLSACANELMTPNNILNMAMLKKLDIIAITDHGSAKQLSVINELRKSYDFLVIPGIEISVAERFHMVVYFYSFDDAIKFDSVLEKFIVKVPFDTKKYGEQMITDIYDETVMLYPYKLSAPISIGYKKVIELLKGYRHLIFLAHVNRNKDSGIDYINDIKINGVEVTKNDTSDDFIKKHQLMKYPIIYNSDAHNIVEIQERESYNYLELEELTVEAFFRYFNG